MNVLHHYWNRLFYIMPTIRKTIMFGDDANDENNHSHECFITDKYVVFQTIDYDSFDYNHDFIKIRLDEWDDILKYIKEEIKLVNNG